MYLYVCMYVYIHSYMCIYILPAAKHLWCCVLNFLDMVLDQQEVAAHLENDVRKKVKEALLKQHHHQNQKKLANRIPIVRSFADIGKRQSETNCTDKNGIHLPLCRKYRRLQVWLCKWCTQNYIQLHFKSLAQYMNIWTENYYEQGCIILITSDNKSQ